MSRSALSLDSCHVWHVDETDLGYRDVWLPPVAGKCGWEKPAIETIALERLSRDHLLRKIFVTPRTRP